MAEGTPTRRVMTIRPLLALVAATLLLAGGAAAQPTPETPGPAGAAAAVETVIAAQRDYHWDALLRLVAPDDVAAMRADAHALIADARLVLVDSAAIVAMPEYVESREGWGEDERFAQAHEVLEGEAYAARSGQDLLERLMALAYANDYGYNAAMRRVALRPVGALAEGDTLAHVVTREIALDSLRRRSDVGLVTMRWTGNRWTLGNPDEATWQDLTLAGLRYEIRALAAFVREDAPEEDAPWTPPGAMPPGVPSSASATPETRGPVGAEAAAFALVEAQRAQDWPAVFHLVNPGEISGAAAGTRFMARTLHTAVADSANVVAQEGFRREFGSDPAVFFRMARRLDAVLPPGDSLSDVEVMTRVLLAADARQPGRFYGWMSPGPTIRVLGSVPETDALVHVLIRPASDGPGGAQLVSMRWDGDRWTTAEDGLGFSGVLGHLNSLLGNWMEIIGGVMEDPDGRSRETSPADEPADDE